MAMNTLYKFLKIAGAVQTNQVTDEQYTNVGADTFQLGTIKRAFLGATDMVIRTAAAGGGDLLVEGVDYTIEDEDFDYTAEAGFHVYTGIKILTVGYQSGDLYFTYKTIGSYTDPDVFNAYIKGATRVGSVLHTMEDISIDASNPWWNIANPTQTLDASNFVDYVPFLRSIAAGPRWSSAVLTGTVTLAGTVLTGSGTNFDSEINVGDLVFIEKLNQFRYIATRTSDTAATVSEPGIAAAGARIWKITRAAIKVTTFPITSYHITAADSFSLWLNESSTTKQPENYILLAGLAEAYAYDREYGTITLPSAIGGIPAGEYEITSITLSNVGTSDAVIVCSASGLTPGSETADTSNISIYPHRIAGSTTTARHYEVVDSALMNDGLYNILGLRSRDYAQGWQLGATADSTGARNYWGRTVSRDQQLQAVVMANHTSFTLITTGEGDYRSLRAMSNGIDETPRGKNRTHSRADIHNIYHFIGDYIA